MKNQWLRPSWGAFSAFFQSLLREWDLRPEQSASAPGIEARPRFAGHTAREPGMLVAKTHRAGALLLCRLAERRAAATATVLAHVVERRLDRHFIAVLNRHVEDLRLGKRGLL